MKMNISGWKDSECFGWETWGAYNQWLNVKQFEAELGGGGETRIPGMITQEASQNDHTKP